MAKQSLRKQFPNTYAEFDKYGASVVKEMRTRLYNNGNVASEDLYNSLDYDIAEGVKGFDLGFLMEDYGDFIDKGRNGIIKQWRSDHGLARKFPPISVIREWVKLKGIPESAVYPIQRKVGLQGFRGNFFYTISTTRREKQFLKTIEKAMQKDIQEFTTKELSNGSNNS